MFLRRVGALLLLCWLGLLQLMAPLLSLPYYFLSCVCLQRPRREVLTALGSLLHFNYSFPNLNVLSIEQPDMDMRMSEIKVCDHSWVLSQLSCQSMFLIVRGGFPVAQCVHTSGSQVLDFFWRNFFLLRLEVFLVHGQDQGFGERCSTLTISVPCNGYPS